MWSWLQDKLGITDLKGRLEMADKKITDLKPVLDAISGAVAPLGAGVASLLARIQQLQNNANNPANPTTLTPDDQATLNAMFDEATQIQTALSGVAAQLAPADQTGTDTGGAPAA